MTSLINGASAPRYSETGHVLFARENALHVVPFDAGGFRVTGAETRLLDGLMTHPNGAAQFAVSQNGVLAFVAGGELRQEPELVWVDRQGTISLLTNQRQTFLGPRLSPDGRQLVVASWEGANLDVWRFDLTRGVMTRLTTHAGEDFGAIWSPDGQRLALASEIGEDTGEVGPALAWFGSPSGSVEQLLRSPAVGDWEFPTSWSPDGKWIAFVRTRGGGQQNDVFLIPTTDPREPRAFLDGPAAESGAMFSPDGRWMAYVSDETGRNEVYVTPFPGPAPRTQVSTGGGVEPLWSRNGRELFYREDNRLMAVAFGGTTEPIGRPRALFEGRFEKTGGMGGDNANYDVALDGRFVMVRRKNLVEPTVIINVILNWPAALDTSRR